MIKELTQPASMNMPKMLTCVVVSLWGSCGLPSHTVRSRGPSRYFMKETWGRGWSHDATCRGSKWKISVRSSDRRAEWKACKQWVTPLTGKGEWREGRGGRLPKKCVWVRKRDAGRSWPVTGKSPQMRFSCPTFAQAFIFRKHRFLRLFAFKSKTITQACAHTQSHTHTKIL